jgi:hypothetical protein
MIAGKDTAKIRTIPKKVREKNLTILIVRYAIYTIIP